MRDMKKTVYYHYTVRQYRYNVIDHSIRNRNENDRKRNVLSIIKLLRNVH